MKNKITGIILGLTIGSFALTGCAGSSSTAGSTQELYGQVTEVSDDSITIETGTLKDSGGQQPGQQDTADNTAQADGQQSDANDTSDADTAEDVGDQPAGEAPSMLELDGNTKEIAINDDTVLTRQGMEQALGGNKQDGTTEQSGNESSASQSDGTDSTAEEPAENGQAPEMPAGDNGGQQEEEVTLDDISEGDTVLVTLNSDGTVAKVTVLSQGMGGGRQPGNAPDNGDAAESSTKDSSTAAATDEE
ncbi:hypothetical protein [Muricomes intestini]|uniref:hypothetical protein n=1 Tax=Muricomes intestini TaxID=1796634 RepID=UPI002FE08AC0